MVSAAFFRHIPSADDQKPTFILNSAERGFQSHRPGTLPEQILGIQLGRIFGVRSQVQEKVDQPNWEISSTKKKQLEKNVCVS
jgi:hypothetical protein